ncbi:MAG: tetratricopeptide repeat protein [Hyphomicrobiales bacterium]|nr:tetratricopeptide repeat protein [Hyphomicrobiales bacterium]
MTSSASAIGPDSPVARTLADQAQALYAAACKAWAEGRCEAAVACLDDALRLRPGFAEALAMGGYILAESGNAREALRFYRGATALKPSLTVAHLNAGKLLFGLGRFDEALAAFEMATEFAPEDADAWSSRAGALRELGRLEESLASARRAFALKPDMPEAAINLGNALLKLDRMEEALAAYRRASAVRPGYAAALCGQALALRNLGRFDEALAAFEAAEALGSREAIAGKGCLFLTLGDFERGLAGYEARWLKGKSLAEALGTRFPTWAGPGRRAERVLVLNDHGLGDTIQFVRYLPLMAKAGVEATFVCPANLHRLLSSALSARLAETAPDQPFDAQIALSSLPHAFGTRLDTIPADVPYLSPEAPAGGALGGAPGRRRLQDRRRLAGQPEPRGRSRPLLPARGARPALGGRGGEACLPAEGPWRRTARKPAARHARRELGRRIRQRS